MRKHSDVLPRGKTWSNSVARPAVVPVDYRRKHPPLSAADVRLAIGRFRTGEHGAIAAGTASHGRRFPQPPPSGSDGTRPAAATASCRCAVDSWMLDELLLFRLLLITQQQFILLQLQEDLFRLPDEQSVLIVDVPAPVRRRRSRLLSDDSQIVSIHQQLERIAQLIQLVVFVDCGGRAGRILVAHDNVRFLQDGHGRHSLGEEGRFRRRVRHPGRAIR